jgi:hypothetical protein
MTILRFPRTVASNHGPRPIHVCAARFDDLPYAVKKFGFGYSRDEARTRFYEGGVNQHIEAAFYTVAKAPNWLKFQLVSQFGLYVQRGQPLSPVEEEASERLGPDPYKYGKGPRRPKKR